MTARLRGLWKVGLGVFLVLLLTLAYVAFHYRGHVSSAFGWISEEIGGTAMAIITIALTLVAVIYTLFCLVFPFIILFGLRDLRRQMTRMSRTLDLLHDITGRVRGVDSVASNRRAEAEGD